MKVDFTADGGAVVKTGCLLLNVKVKGQPL